MTEHLALLLSIYNKALPCDKKIQSLNRNCKYQAWKTYRFEMVLIHCIENNFLQTELPLRAVSKTIHDKAGGLYDFRFLRARTPLMGAIWRSNPERVVDLLQLPSYQSTATNSDKAGWTPLHFACNVSTPHLIVDALLKCNADPNARNVDGSTPLHYIAGSSEPGDVATLKLLLDAKGDPNIQDIDGCSPLHEAVENNSPIMAKLLHQAGSNVLLKDGDGIMPLQLNFAANMMFLWRGVDDPKVLNELIRASYCGKF